MLAGRQYLEDVRQVLDRARSEVTDLRTAAAVASLHKRYCLDVADVSQICLYELEKSLATHGMDADGPENVQQFKQLIPAATKLLLATRHASHRVKKLAQPTGFRRLLAWSRRRAYKEKLICAKYEMTSALDYAAAVAGSSQAAMEAAVETARAQGNSSGDPDAPKSGSHGASMLQAAALAVLNFQPGTLRCKDQARPVAAVRFMPVAGSGSSGRGVADAAILLLVQLTCGHVEVYTPTVHGFHSTLSLVKPTGRLTATAVDWAAQALWTCFSDGSVVLTRLDEQRAEQYACSHTAITCAHAVPGALWVGDAAGRVVCLQCEPTLMVRVVTWRGAPCNMPAVACVWAHPQQPSVAAAAEADGWLALIDGEHFSVTASYDCSAFGAATSITSVPWSADGGGTGDRAGLLFSLPHAAPGLGTGWRLLTGHSSGVLVLWDVAGGGLKPMSVIGERAAPVRSLAVLPELAMLVSGHRDGLLRVWPLPCPRMHLLPLPHAQPQRWSLRHGAVRTPHGRLACMDRCGTRLVTAGEAGDVEVWDVLDLRARALQQGASFASLTKPTSQAVCAALATADAATAQLAEAKCSPTSLPAHLQLAALQLYTELHRRPAAAPWPAQLPAAAAAAVSAAAGQLPGAPQADLAPTEMGLLTTTVASLGAPGSPTALDSALLQEYLRRAAATHLGGGAATVTAGGGAGGGYGLGASAVTPQAAGMQGVDPHHMGLLPVPAPAYAAAGGGATSPMWVMSMQQQGHAAAPDVLGAGNLFSVPEEDGVGTGGAGSTYGADDGGGGGSPVPAGAGAAELVALTSQFLKASDTQLLEPMAADGNTSREVRVWRGTWRHTPVLVHELQPGSPALEPFVTLARELERYPGAALNPTSWALLEELKRLSDASPHPHVVRLIGVCLEPPRVVTEDEPALEPLHSLMDRARVGDPSASARLQWMDRLALLHDVAAGMAFLHDRQSVHGELLAHNVFVTSEGRARLGGLGFAQLQARLRGAGAATELMSGPASASHWLATEAALTHDNTYAGDVYSFASLAYELLTCTAPDAALTPRQATATQACCQALWSSERVPQMGYASGSFNSLKQLITECWAPRVEDRPSFACVAAQLRGIIDCEQAVLTMRANVSALLAQRSVAREAPRQTRSGQLGAEQPVAERATPAATVTSNGAARRSTSSQSSGPSGCHTVATSVSSGFTTITSRASLNPDGAGGIAAPPSRALLTTGSVHGFRPAGGSSVLLSSQGQLPGPYHEASVTHPPLHTPSIGASHGLLPCHSLRHVNPSLPASEPTPGSGLLEGAGGSGGSSAGATTPTFDMLIAGASGVQRLTGLPVAVGRSRVSGAVGSDGPASAAAALGRLGSHDGVAGAGLYEARLERLATAGLAEAAAEVLQTVVGPSRRTTAMQTDTGQVILLIEETDEEAGVGSAGEDVTAEATEPSDSATADADGIGSAEQADLVADLPPPTHHVTPWYRLHAASTPDGLKLSPPQELLSAGMADGADASASGDGASGSPSPSRLGDSAPSFASVHPAARRILGASRSRRAASAGSGGGVVVALASLQGSGVSFKGGGASNLGKGNLSLKGMSSLAAAVKTFPVEVVSALLSWAPSPGQPRRTCSGFGMSEGPERSVRPSPSVSVGRLSPGAADTPSCSPGPRPQHA